MPGPNANGADDLEDFRALAVSGRFAALSDATLVSPSTFGAFGVALAGFTPLGVCAVYELY